MQTDRLSPFPLVVDAPPRTPQAPKPSGLERASSQRNPRPRELDEVNDDAAPQKRPRTTAGKRSGARVVAYSLAALALLAVVLAPIASAVTPQETAAADSVYVGPTEAYGHANGAIQPCFDESFGIFSFGNYVHPIQHVGASITAGHRYVVLFAPENTSNEEWVYSNATGDSWTIQFDGTNWNLVDVDPSSSHALTLVRDQAVNESALSPNFALLAVAWTALPGDEMNDSGLSSSSFLCLGSFGNSDRVSATGWSSVACGPEQSAEGTTTSAIEATPGYSATDTSPNYPVWQAVALYFDVTTLNGTEPTTCPTTHVEMFTGGGDSGSSGVSIFTYGTLSTAAACIVDIASASIGAFLPSLSLGLWAIIGFLLILAVLAILWAIAGRFRRGITP